MKAKVEAETREVGAVTGREPTGGGMTTSPPARYRFFMNGSEPRVLNAIAATNHSSVPSRMRSSMISPKKPRTMHARARIVQIIGLPPLVMHCTPSGEEDPVAHAINEAPFAAGNLVYDFAGRFDRREEYRPVEELAQRVQAIVVQTASRILREENR